MDYHFQIVCRVCRLIKYIPSQKDPSICKECYAHYSKGTPIDIENLNMDYERMNELIYEKALEYKRLQSQTEELLKSFFILEQELLSLMDYYRQKDIAISDLSIKINEKIMKVLDYEKIKKNMPLLQAYLKDYLLRTLSITET